MPLSCIHLLKPTVAVLDATVAMRDSLSYISSAACKQGESSSEDEVSTLAIDDLKQIIF